jgi:general stress protein YciG
MTDKHIQTSHPPGRNPDGTFTAGSEAAKQAGHIGGLHAHHKVDEKIDHPPGRNPDGTFVKGSEAAKEAGHIGGLHAHHLKDVNELEVQSDVSSASALISGGCDGLLTIIQDGTGRNPDGTFKKGSEAAKEAGHVGGLHAHNKE